MTGKNRIRNTWPRTILEKLARKAVRPRLRHRQRKAQSLTHKVGYIGCSNSQDTVDGYHLSPGNRNYLWPSYDTGGGSIDKWADASSLYWTSYSAMLTKYGQPKYVWVQLCERAYQGAFNTYDQVKIMIGNLKRKSPNAAVIVSGINDYSPNPRLCDLMGTASASSPGNGVYDTKLWASRPRIRAPRRLWAISLYVCNQTHLEKLLSGDLSAPTISGMGQNSNPGGDLICRIRRRKFHRRPRA
jgi:hypothetical protein